MSTQQKIRKQHSDWEFPDFDEEKFTKKRQRYCICVFVINEGERIRKQLKKMVPLASKMDIVIADGGSTDGSLDASYLKAHNVRALLTKRGKGKLSAQMRMAFAWAIHEGYEGVVVVDGNNKDSVERAPQFIELLERGYDHVQGSRFIPGGKAINTPLSREIGLHVIHAPLISLASRKRHTDTTNGFRAYSARLLTDTDMGVFRDIFQTYELHYHLAIESSRSKKYKTIETPVVRSYPKNEKTPTKISPVKGNAHVLGVLFKAVFGMYRVGGNALINLAQHVLQTRWPFLLLLISVAGFAFNVAMAYPGYMSLDSLRQLQQATGGQPYTDWHPPVMALVWSIGIAVTGKAASMLILQSLLLWVAIFLLAWWMYEATHSKKLSLLAIFLGFTPFILAVSGVIWKDTQMAHSLFLAFVASLWVKRARNGKKWIFFAVSLAAVAYALLLRYNALFAVLPIATYLFASAGFKKRASIGMAIMTIVFIFTGGAVLSKALKVEPSHAIVSVMIDDVVNSGGTRSFNARKINMSAQSIKVLESIEKSCGEKGVILHAYHFCSTAEQQSLVRSELYDDIARAWRYTILHHPAAYIKYRIATMVLFMTTPKEYEYIKHSGVIDNPYGMTVRHEVLSNGVTAYVDYFAKDIGMVFRPYFWFLCASMLLIYTQKKDNALLRSKATVALVLSSILYMLGYFPVVIAADYRYIYWSVIAVLVACCLVVTGRYRLKHYASQRTFDDV